MGKKSLEGSDFIERGVRRKAAWCADEGFLRGT